MGPYETERDTLREPMPREVRAAQTAGAEQHDVTGLRLIGAGADIVLRHLADACDAAGVEIADYDRRILAWLSRWEPSTAQVVIGLVTRAHEAGKRAEGRRQATEGWERGCRWGVVLGDADEPQYKCGSEEDARSFAATRPGSRVVSQASSRLVGPWEPAEGGTP